MEVPSVTNELEKEDKACKSLPDKFDSVVFLEESVSTLSKESQNANLDGKILYGMRTFSSDEDINYNDKDNKSSIKCGSSSKSIIDNDKDKSGGAHTKSPNASILKKSSSKGNNSSVSGNKMVWRVAGSNKTSEGTTPLKVDVASLTRSASVHGENLVGCIARSNETPNVTKLSKVKKKDVSVTGNASQGPLIPRDAYLDFSGTSSSTSNVSSTSLKVDATSISRSSSVHGQNIVWRIAESNGTSNVTKLSKVKGNGNASQVPLISNDAYLDFAKTSISTSNTSSTPLKVERASVARSSSVLGENFVWRIVGSNETYNATKPANVMGNDFPVNAPQGPVSRNSYLDLSDTSSSTSNASSDDDIETFLYEMLGRGFQLERSTIREVLGNCGYDMKKSVEALLELSAVQFDRRNNLSEASRLHSNGKSFLSENQKQNRNSVERFSSVPSRQPKLGLLTAPFDAPEKPDLTGSACVPKPFASSTMEVVTEGDNTEYFKDEPTCPNFDDVKDDAEEGSYYSLRKAVKENRETMKQYYKAAADAFAMGDRDRAVSLLEKGQVFYGKAREADEESVSKIFETSGSGDVNGEEEVCLDLHDHDAKEAIRLVKIHLRTLSGIPSVRDLKINIGNDDQFVEKRKRFILKLLNKEDIKWIEDENSGAILVRLDEINPKNLSFGKT